MIMMAVSALALTLPPTHESTKFLAISLSRDLENGSINLSLFINMPSVHYQKLFLKKDLCFHLTSHFGITCSINFIPTMLSETFTCHK